MGDLNAGVIIESGAVNIQFLDSEASVDSIAKKVQEYMEVEEGVVLLNPNHKRLLDSPNNYGNYTKYIID